MSGKNNQVRRIITENNKDGLSYVREDAFAENISYPVPGNQDLALINLWGVKSVPTAISDLGSFGQAPVPLTPNANGITFRYVDFPPDAELLGFLDTSNIKKAWDHLKTKQNEPRLEKLPHPLMHTTNTVDFGIVLSGEIVLILDQEERLMKAGDVAIQRGTHHAWSNRSSQICRMAFILIDAQ